MHITSHLFALNFTTYFVPFLSGPSSIPYNQAAAFVTTLFASFSSLFINMLKNMGSHIGPLRTLFVVSFYCKDWQFTAALCFLSFI